jgi:hypothetical protein
MSRDELLENLSGRLRTILSDFHSPKLDDPKPPYFHRTFAPHVRDASYRDIGSAAP